MFFEKYASIIENRPPDLPSDYEFQIESLVEASSSRLASSLRHNHGACLNFSWLTKPYYYLFSFIFVNAVQCQPRVVCSEPISVPMYPNLQKLAAESLNGATHQLVHRLLHANNPAEYLSGILDHCPRLDQDFVSEGGDIVGPEYDGGDAIGFTYSMPFADRVQLKARLFPRKLKFLRFDRAGLPANYDPTWRGLLLEQFSQQINADTWTLEQRFYALSLVLMPTYLLEDFRHYWITCSSQLADVRCLFIGPEFHVKSGAAVAIAVVKSRGGRVVGLVHGGSYGQTDPSWNERAERYLADYYMTWGYTSNSHDIPLPSDHLSRVRPIEVFRRLLAKSRRDKDELLVVLPYIARSLHISVLSPPAPSQIQAVQSALAIIAPVMNAGFRLVLRLHPRSNPTDLDDCLPHGFGSNWRLQIGRRGALTSDAGCFGAVIFLTPDATGMSECAAADMPFFIAARREDFYIQQHAKPCYEQLINSGVWITDDCALTTNARHALHWSAEKQAAFVRFKHLFAFSSLNYLKQWSQLLRSL